LLALAELASQSGSSPDDVAKLIGNAIAAKPLEADIRLLLIDFHLRNRDTKSASSADQSAAGAMPNNPKILAALGRTQQAAGDLNQAITTYNQLATLLPQSPLPLKRLAEAQLAAKDRSAASNSLQKAIAIQPKFLDGQRMLIDIALADSKFQDAIKIARTIQKQRPTEIAGYSLEGDISASQKNWETAIAAYRAGLKVNKNTALALKLHAVLRDSGNTAEANRFAGTWQKEHATDAAFLFYMADAALARQDCVFQRSWTPVSA
jgi:tetratricopeptide (TPR) repeat protein